MTCSEYRRYLSSLSPVPQPANPPLGHPLPPKSQSRNVPQTASMYPHPSTPCLLPYGPVRLFVCLGRRPRQTTMASHRVSPSPHFWCCAGPALSPRLALARRDTGPKPSSINTTCSFPTPIRPHLVPSHLIPHLLPSCRLPHPRRQRSRQSRAWRHALEYMPVVPELALLTSSPKDTSTPTRPTWPAGETSAWSSPTRRRRSRT